MMPATSERQSEMMLESEAAFAQLRPVCELLMAAACAEGPPDDDVTALAKELGATLDTLPTPGVQRCCEYVLLPLLKLLPSFSQLKRGGDDQPRADGTSEALLDAVRALVRATTPAFVQRRPDVFLRLANAMLGALECPGSEETKLQAARLAQEMVEEAGDSITAVPTQGVFDLMCGGDGELKGLFAQMTLAFLEGAQQSSNRALQQGLLAALEALVGAVGRRDAEQVANVLPGITGALGKIITADFKLGSGVRCAAIRCWRRVLVIALADGGVVAGRNRIGDANGGQDEASASARFMQRVAGQLPPQAAPERVETAQRVRRALDAVLQSRAVTETDNWRVHLALVDLAGSLLRSCATAVLAADGLAALLVDCLAAHAMSEVAETRAAAEAELATATAHLRALPGNPWAGRVCPALETLARQRLLALPRAARGASEASLRHALRSALGLVRAMPAQVEVLLDVSLDDTIDSLLQTVQLVRTAPQRHGGNAYVTLLAAVGGARSETSGFPAPQYEHFAERRTARLVDDLLAELGAGPGKARLLARLAAGVEDAVRRHASSDGGAPLEGDSEEIVLVTPRQLPEALLLLARVLVGTPADASQQRSAVRRCLEFALELQVDSAQSQALRLELLGTCAALSGGQWAAKRLLVRLLFPVMQHVPSDGGQVVQHAALCALQQLASSAGFEGPRELVKANMDYILDAAMERLEDLPSFPDTPQVLKAVVELLDDDDDDRPLQPGLAPFLADLVEAVLRGVDAFSASPDERYLVSLLGVIRRVLRCVRPPDAGTRDELAEAAKPESDPIQTLLDELNVDLFEPPPEEGDGGEADETEDHAGAEGLAPTRQARGPLHVELAQTSLHRARNLTRHRSLFVRQLVFQVSEEALQCLGRKELLPQVNELWPSVVGSLRSEPSPACLCAALALAKSCLVLTERFLARRFMADALPEVERLVHDETDPVRSAAEDLACEAARRLPPTAFSRAQVRRLAGVSPALHQALLERHRERLWGLPPPVAGKDEGSDRQSLSESSLSRT